MLPNELKMVLELKLKASHHPRELVVDTMLAMQGHYGYLSDEAVAETAALVGMSTVEVEELATFYPFIYREPVGRYVIHVCDSVVCWMGGHELLQAHLMQRLGIGMGDTTTDGLFTLLAVCCIGYCDRAPAILINKRVYGHLDPEKLDEIIARLRREAGV